jgi:hypothetical protein
MLTVGHQLDSAAGLVAQRQNVGAFGQTSGVEVVRGEVLENQAPLRSDLKKL